MNRNISIDNLPDIFSASELAVGGKLSNRVAGYAIKKYMKEKRVIKLKRDLYSKVADPFYIAGILYKGYVGFSSALYLHGLKPEVEATITVCTADTQKRTKLLDKIILPVNMSNQFYGYSLITINGLDIPVAAFTKTIFDMFYRPKYANFYDMYSAINNRGLSKKEWETLMHYLVNSNLTTVRRLGYGLEDKAPKWFIQKLLRISKAGSRTSFFFSHKPINYNAKWDIFDDINIKKWKNAL